jgi:hypothetical protein
MDDDFSKNAKVDKGRNDVGGAGAFDATIGLDGTLGIAGAVGQVGGNYTVDDSMQELYGALSSPMAVGPPKNDSI